MIADLKPYAEYKESGLPWLGRVPGHWDVRRLKSHLLRNDSGVWGTHFDERGTVVLRSTEQSVDGGWRLRNPARIRLSNSQKTAALLALGDLVVTKSSGSALHIGKTSLVTHRVAEMECCFSNFMQRLRVSQKVLSPEFAWSLLNSRVGREQFVYQTTTTTGLGNLNGTILGNCVFAFPPPDEQAAIVRFLDWANGRLERAIRAKRKVIALLSEQKQAIIHRAVTRGLDPAVPLPAPSPGRFFVYAIECKGGSHYIGQTQDLRQRWKDHVEGRAADWTAAHPPVCLAHFEEFESREEAVKREKDLKTGFGRKWLKDTIASGRARQAGLKPSGIPWLGDIPQHWEVRQLRHMGRLHKGVGGSKEDTKLEGIPCVRYGELYFHFTNFIRQPHGFVSVENAAAYMPIRFGDVLFAASGEKIEEIGKSAVNLYQGQAVCGGDVVIFRPNVTVHAAFLGYALDSYSAAHQKATMCRGTTIKHIYPDELRSLWTCVPPVSEQEQITEYLDRELLSCNTAISRLEREIELLREYRTRLVADVVTGKLDVRDLPAATLAAQAGVEARLPDEVTKTNEAGSAEEDCLGEDGNAAREPLPEDEE